MKRIEELDFARMLSMVAVILIHVTSTYIYNESRFQIFNINIAFILNQVARFSVPLFILLSGASLALSGAENKGCGHFYWRRITKIGVPYLFWFLIYFMYDNHAHLNTVHFHSLVKSLLLGQAAPHLYFIVIIFQFYLLYPLLKKVVDKAPWTTLLISFMVSYIIEKQFFFLTVHVDVIPKTIRPYLWILFPTWLFYFVAGLILTRERLLWIQKFCKQKAIPIIVVTVVFSAFYVMESHITETIDAIKPSLNLFTPLMLLCAFALWGYWGKYAFLKKITRFFSKHSFTIYLEHVLVLYFLRRFSFFQRGMSGMLWLFLTVVIGSTLLAVLIDGFVMNLKRGCVKIADKAIR